MTSLVEVYVDDIANVEGKSVVFSLCVLELVMLISCGLRGQIKGMLSSPKLPINYKNYVNLPTVGRHSDYTRAYSDRV